MTLVKTFYPLLKKGGREGNERILIAYPLRCASTSAWGCTYATSVTSDMTPTREVSPLFYREKPRTPTVTCTMAFGGWVADLSWESCTLWEPMAPANSTPPWHEVLEGEVCISHTVFFFSKLSLSLLVSMWDKRDISWLSWHTFLEGIQLW